MLRTPFFLGLLIIAVLFFTTAQAQPNLFDPSVQTNTLLSNEYRTVYLGNLERRQNGAPPLRMNWQLTRAARWFSWDSVENRATPYCGHQDTQGNWPSARAKNFGYPGLAGAENAFCGNVPPENAVAGWMGSQNHRSSLLDPNTKETGMGYYFRSSDNTGYVVQDFGADPAYNPAVINNEALETNSTQVSVYKHNISGPGDLAQAGAATQMRLANDQCFNGAWQPFTSDSAWQLSGGTGWRTVNVRTRDALNRTTNASDTIYLGSNAPLNEINESHFSTVKPNVNLYGLDGGSYPSMQFSAGWLADDGYANFALMWGAGARVNDAAAIGGTAFRMPGGGAEAFAWVWTTSFIKQTPFIAYFRLKVNSNSSAAEVARIGVHGGGVEYGPISIKGTDFAAPNQYQEFALPFTFNNTADLFLEFEFWRSGSADVYVDTVTVFTNPVPVTSTYSWNLPGGSYRGQGVWVRYTNANGGFTPYSEALTAQPQLTAGTNSLVFLAERNKSTPAARQVVINPCPAFTWQAESSAAWLSVQNSGSGLRVSANTNGMNKGIYTASITLRATNQAGVPPLTIPVRLSVVDKLNTVYLGAIAK